MRLFSSFGPAVLYCKVAPTLAIPNPLPFVDPDYHILDLPRASKVLGKPPPCATNTTILSKLIKQNTRYKDLSCKQLINAVQDADQQLV